MPFFQNCFMQEFRGSCAFGDRQYSLTFSVPANQNQSQAMIAWNLEPYDFSVYDDFVINFSIDANNSFKAFTAISVNVAGATPGVTLANEVVALLNADVEFSSWFIASVVNNGVPGNPQNRVGIRAKNDRQAIRVYITNAGAEQKLGFNKKAGVAELPTYYSRHTIENRYVFPDGLAALVQLDETDSTVDQPIITNAGFDYSAMKEDWQLLAGRVGIFTFQKITVDGSDRITEIIEYSAGSGVGDMARKIAYTYTGANKNPDQITEIPFTLESGDLISP